MNKAILMGRLTKDPELRHTSTNNVACCNFTIAVDRKFQKQGEEKQTDFIPVVTWNKTAEFCGNWFKKGKRVLVSGRIQVRSWDDENGNKRWATEVVADEVEFADGKGDSGYEPMETSKNNNTASVKEDIQGLSPLDVDTELPF